MISDEPFKVGLLCRVPAATYALPDTRSRWSQNSCFCGATMRRSFPLAALLARVLFAAFGQQ